jgi:hypothetical protein
MAYVPLLGRPKVETLTPQEEETMSLLCRPSVFNENFRSLFDCKVSDPTLAQRQRNIVITHSVLRDSNQASWGFGVTAEMGPHIHAIQALCKSITPALSAEETSEILSIIEGRLRRLNY